jgi:hypothetical protein
VKSLYGAGAVFEKGNAGRTNVLVILCHKEIDTKGENDEYIFFHQKEGLLKQA